MTLDLERGRHSAPPMPPPQKGVRTLVKDNISGALVRRADSALRRRRAPRPEDPFQPAGPTPSVLAARRERRGWQQSATRTSVSPSAITAGHFDEIKERFSG